MFPASLPELSIVIPVYNSADIFPELHRRLAAVLGARVKSFEIIAVVDGCRDKSAEVIGALADKDPRIKMVEFSRNFGHQAAITAGLEFAEGEVVVVMDDDLEDPPEILPGLIAQLNEGFDVVYGVRRKRRRALPYRVLYRLFYRLLGLLVNVKIPADAGDFCAMRRPVIDAINSMPESNRYLRGMRAWCGFRQVGFEYDRGQRFANEPGYTLRKYVALALDAIFSFSYAPLKFVSLAGFLIAGISFLYGARLIVGRLTGEYANVPGWASLQVSILFLSGIQLISMGIVGEYVARIYDEVKQRPKFVIKKLVGIDRDHTND
ncbi:MAG TPA: glycosyltransferase family 2 protein [Verrucomicrobiae bacterium]|nr:glycosyltransferase family 2 protein [Verrucomicrobiae bacterium]